MLNFEYETYSEDLVFASRVLTQLQVNLNHHFHNFQELKDNSHPDFKYAVQYVDDQVQQLEELQELAKLRFQTLLLNESRFDLKPYPEAPYVYGQPDWVDDLFKSPKMPWGAEERLKAIGGYVISFKETGNETWIDPNVPESFIKVWYPVCGDFECPGYLRFTKDKSWIAYSEEH